ncbi:hypothetical protein BUALT_Bualt02G0206900 [Buddleja alternifolia]|uniref:HNH nuclease domain-containing protein n=1 Tax=Buddleja alternifolia TaxID=168488 RepID=A0AAV6Y9W5_9LAMI|nr:hypothetical protein BUALT_Bualt02G0206900 [Buddleja alternifolia]
MAQFTTGGRVKSLFSGDGLAVAFDGKLKAALAAGGGGRLRLTYLPSGDRKRKLSFNGGFTVNASTSSPPSSSSYRSNSDGVLDEILEEDPEFEIDELAGFRGLVLDISYRPVNVVCWKRAICLEFMDKADVLEYYDQTINSPNGSFYIPAVLRVPHLLQVVKRRKVKRGLSRKNIFQRDNFTCQYCSATENLTIDHVLPIARGGKWTWENLVAACAKCNSKKGQKTLEEAYMKLMKVPKAPKDYDILAIPLTNHTIKMLKMRKGMPEEWKQYLSTPYVGP